MTLEYREIRRKNINSFFNRRCPGRRRRGYVNSLISWGQRRGRTLAAAAEICGGTDLVVSCQDLRTRQTKREVNTWAAREMVDRWVSGWDR